MVQLACVGLRHRSLAGGRRLTALVDPFERNGNDRWDGGMPKSEQPDAPGYDRATACYRRLWLTVLARAVDEAHGRMLGVMTGDGESEQPGVLIAMAQAWLGSDSPDLRAVCDLSGVNIEDILRLYGGKDWGRRG